MRRTGKSWSRSSWIFCGWNKKRPGTKVPGSDCRKTPSGLSDRFSQSAARRICSPTANKFHTCSLRCIFGQVHALTENDSDSICRVRGKLCEAFLTRWARYESTGFSMGRTDTLMFRRFPSERQTPFSESGSCSRPQRRNTGRTTESPAAKMHKNSPASPARERR